MLNLVFFSIMSCSRLFFAIFGTTEAAHCYEAGL